MAEMSDQEDTMEAGDQVVHHGLEAEAHGTDPITSSG